MGLSKSYLRIIQTWRREF